MDQMIAPYGGNVAVAAYDERDEVGIVKLGACGKGQGSPVECVEGIGLEMGGGYPSRAADSRHKQQAVHGELHFIDGA
jgi:hypothetical protein